MPEGVPFKVSNVLQIREAVGTFVVGVNKPLILVSDLLTKAERANTARHELIEWQRMRSAEALLPTYGRESHRIAEKRTNPRLTKSSRQSHKRQKGNG